MKQTVMESLVEAANPAKMQKAYNKAFAKFKKVAKKQAAKDVDSYYKEAKKLLQQRKIPPKLKYYYEQGKQIGNKFQWNTEDEFIFRCLHMEDISQFGNFKKTLTAKALQDNHIVSDAAAKEWFDIKWERLKKKYEK